MRQRVQDLLDNVQCTACQVGGVAADAAYGVGRKTQQLLSTAKLNVQISGLELQVRACMAQIGEMLYATHTGTPTESEVLLAKLEEIDGLKARIAALRREADRLQGRERPAACPTCGAPVQEGDTFCRTCGGAL